MKKKDLLFELCVLLTKAGDATVKAREKELERYGLTVPKDAVLRIIHVLGEKASPAEISRWMIREDHSVSEILNRMEEDGLVRKSKISGQKKGIRVTLTERGEQLHRAVSVNTNITLSIFECLSAEEGKQLKNALNKVLTEALKQLELTRKPNPSLIRAIPTERASLETHQRKTHRGPPNETGRGHVPISEETG